jgi:hypothetical protein
MKNTLMIMFFSVALFACNDSNTAAQTEIKNEIQTTDSLNLEIDKAQEELEETMDAVVDILNIL